MEKAFVLGKPSSSIIHFLLSNHIPYHITVLKKFQSTRPMQSGTKGIVIGYIADSHPCLS